jgi:CDP-diacylglycerol--glycerol-3-phosphate 3-phosphatidyltransferase
MKNIPNILTILRIASSPIICLMIIKGCNNLVYTILFLLASFTDFLDGYLVRKYNLESNFGRCFDPIADKVLVISVLLSLAYTHNANVYCVLLLTMREVIIMGVREFASSQNHTIHVNILGKIKTTVQFITIIALMMKIRIFGFNLGAFGLILSVIISMFSGWVYIVKTFRVVSKS